MFSNPHRFCLLNVFSLIHVSYNIPSGTITFDIIRASQYDQYYRRVNSNLYIYIRYSFNRRIKHMINIAVILIVSKATFANQTHHLEGISHGVALFNQLLIIIEK